MDASGSSPHPKSWKVQPFTRGKLGKLDAAAAARIVAAGGDIAMLIDHDGFIRDIAINSEDLARDGAQSWLDQRWSDTVTVESQHKVKDLLRDALSEERTQWREINQVTPSQNSIMVRYTAVGAGRDGHVIAVGRDDRATASIQMRLQETQQAMERDYARLRDAEFRYRLLFKMSGEAVVVVDVLTKKIIEANPAAEHLVGDARSKLVGEPLTKIFDADSREEAASVLAVAQSSTQPMSAPTRLWIHGRELMVSASLFREGRSTQCLVRLTPSAQDHQAPPEREPQSQALLERFPDAFLATDSALKILSVNTRFLDLVRVPTKERVIGQSLNQFLGRAGLERNILAETLREHGSVRNFSTVLRDQFDEAEDVEVSAIATADGEDAIYSFSVRVARRRPAEPSQNSASPRRSVEQLTELVGRVKLKDLVRESTDLAERLCIEAALELTKNNRASAAELLGLSRQSLYSKLHRFGLGNLSDLDS
jgi:transcriptional regulator PpsR